VDHVGIVKRAWEITWKYRALWILGLFAGSAGGGNGSSFRQGFSNSSSSGGSNRLPGTPGSQFLPWLQANLVAIVLVTTVLILIGIAFWILSVAARGGLVWMSNEAAEQRDVRAGRGWAVGFHYWGRTFLISFLLALPVLLVLVFLVLGSLGSIAGLIEGARSGQASGGGIAGLCGVFALGFVVLVPLAIVVGVLDQLALRHGVLDDLPATRSIATAWEDFRRRFKDVAIMFLLLLAVGIAYGIVIGIASLVFVIPAAGLAIAGLWPLAVAIGLVLFLVLLLPSAIFGAFYSTSWTIFFRRMTGREAAPVAAYAGGYPPPPGGGYMPPPPPGGYAPQPPPMPQPPAPPAPPAPEPSAPQPPAPPAPEPPAPPSGYPPQTPPAGSE
jgi:hypothetical protein